MEKERYYCINKKLFWCCIVFIIGIFSVSVFTIVRVQGMKKDENLTTQRTYVEYEKQLSKLSDVSECYLCGTTNRSVHSLYGGTDSIGIIDLIEWNMLDLRMNGQDSEGEPDGEDAGTNEIFGKTDKIEYSIQSIPARGMAEAEVQSSYVSINDELLTNHLCQQCLDKVVNVLGTDAEVNKSPQYVPFCLVDYQTMEVFSLQRGECSYYVRDYRVEVERDHKKIEVQVYYQPLQSFS